MRKSIAPTTQEYTSLITAFAEVREITGMSLSPVKCQKFYRSIDGQEYLTVMKGWSGSCYQLFNN